LQFFVSFIVNENLPTHVSQCFDAVGWVTERTSMLYMGICMFI